MDSKTLEKANELQSEIAEAEKNLKVISETNKRISLKGVERCGFRILMPNGNWGNIQMDEGIYRAILFVVEISELDRLNLLKKEFSDLSTNEEGDPE